MMADPTKTATLTLNGASYDLPVLTPTLGPDVLDIRKLYAQADEIGRASCRERVCMLV